MAEKRKDVAASYNRLKSFRGKRYTGMEVGGRHKWRYDPGEWREQKVSPDEWTFTYAVNKRRAGRAPEGSGAPVGTAYNWCIVATQIVRKLDADTYSTQMVGAKHKIAHMRASTGAWSASEKTMRRRMAEVLDAMAARLRSQEPEPALTPTAAEAAPRPAASRRPARGTRTRTRRTASAVRRAGRRACSSRSSGAGSWRRRR